MPKSFDDWLAFIQQQHSMLMQLGLERISKVAMQAGLLKKTCPIVLVGGTNGKGSCIHTMTQILLHHGCRVATFISPHIHCFRERALIQNQPCSEQEWEEAFHFVHHYSQGTALTYFEYTTLAALRLFSLQSLDFILLEVGLGGRLDASNVVDPDLSIITSIGFDHCQWLGNTLSAIASEKAGILRYKKPVIIGETQHNQPILKKASALDSPSHVYQHDFTLESEIFCSNLGQKWRIPKNTIHPQALACAVFACQLLRPELKKCTVQHAIQELHIPGRWEFHAEPMATYFDCAHNPQAFSFLKKKILQQKSRYHKIFVLLAMKENKDLLSCVDIISDAADHLISPHQLNASLPCTFHQCSTLEQGYHLALQLGKDEDLLVVCGSFITLAKIQRLGESMCCES
jgi:dihydrofolate synthase / folylpolyglutamate synthase